MIRLFLRMPACLFLFAWFAVIPLEAGDSPDGTARVSGLVTVAGPDSSVAGQAVLYRDRLQPVDVRVRDLLSRLTLEEKLGQMNMPCVYKNELGDSLRRNVRDFEEGTGKTDESILDAKFRDCELFTLGTFNELGPGGGFFTMANRLFQTDVRSQAEGFNHFQRIAMEETRLGIPLLQSEEGTHGLMCSNGTIFPEGLALGSSWNTDLIRDIYAVAAREARALGIHQLFTLVIEPIRDPRLGRNEEAYSEDVYLTSRYAEAIVHGCQGNDVSAPDRVVAGLAHFPGQSQPVSGMEFGPMEMSERIFRSVFLPPWEAGIKKAGGLGVMATHPSIDAFGGLPVHASKKLLTGVLREELGFEGVVLGEGNSIRTIMWKKVVATQKEAGLMALDAGLDVSISLEPGYMSEMFSSVREGHASLADIDRAVGHILEQKFRLGLFENPYVDPDRAVEILHAPEHQELALKAAREGIVLLKNEDHLLPIRKDIGSIAVIGPNADNSRNQLGDYTPRKILHEIVTPVMGIRAAVSSGTKVEYVEGCDAYVNETNQIEQAKRAAKRADVAVVFLGESRDAVGEKRDVASLDLLGRQEELIRAVYSTGTPTIVVLINGRPLSIRWVSEHVPAIIEAWNCGEKGGDAIADVLFGDYNPGGRLPITIPRHSGQLPVYYSMSPSKEMRMKFSYKDMSAEPLYEFGFGLSYTTFGYSNLRITPGSTGTGGQVQVYVDVENTGDTRGTEVVQLYVNDMISSVVTPVIELKGFRKIELDPEEKRTVEFLLTPEHLSLINAGMKRVVEPGLFEIMVGSSSKDIRLRGNLEINEPNILP